jgi:hypothetical protein
VKPPSISTLKAAVAAKKQLESKAAAEAKAAEAAAKPLTARQVSFRMHRKNLLRKTLSSSRWRGAAMKVKVSLRKKKFISLSYLIFNFCVFFYFEIFLSNGVIKP